MDEALAGEQVELADPHRQHGHVAAPERRRRRPAVELVHRDHEAPWPVGQLEGVDVVLCEPEGTHRDATDFDRLAVAQLVDPDPAAVAHELEVRHPTEIGAEVRRDLLRQVDVGDERALCLPGPGAEVAVACLPDPTAHRVVRVPVGVEARGDLADPGTLELELRLLGRVEEDVRPVDEGRGPGAGEATALLARLDADAAATAGPGNRGSTARSQNLDPHTNDHRTGATDRGTRPPSRIRRGRVGARRRRRSPRALPGEGPTRRPARARWRRSRRR